MNESLLSVLMNVHNELCCAASLPKSSRPHSVQSRLTTIQNLIMEEIEKQPATEATDEIPF